MNLLCSSVDYLREIAGWRTVPVELGLRYTDEEWSQELMTVDDFISQYIVNKVCCFHVVLSPQTRQCPNGLKDFSLGGLARAY